MAEDTASATASPLRAPTAMVLGSANSQSTSVCTVVCSNSSDCDTSVSDCVSSVSADSKTTLFNARLTARRPKSLKLETVTHSHSLSSPTSVSSIPVPSTQQYATSKTVNLSFSELSYSVKTGIKRGTC
jgi:hypothetical protein